MKYCLRAIYMIGALLFLVDTHYCYYIVIATDEDVPFRVF